MIEAGRLYDSTGTLIPIPGPVSAPFASITPPGVEHDIRDRYRNYPSKGLTPARLERIMEAADGGDPYEWIELCEEMVEKDPKIRSVLRTRTAAVLGLVRKVMPVQLDDVEAGRVQLAEEIAKACDSALQKTNFSELIRDILDAIGKSFAVDWIDWSDPAQSPVVPQRFRKIPTKHIRWSFQTDTIRVYNPGATTSISGGDIGEVLAPYTTVRALNNETGDHPMRAGLLRTFAWYYLFKNIQIKDWVSYGDRFGTPLRIFKLSESDFRNPEMYRLAKDALRSMGVDGSGVISKDWELTIEATAAKQGITVHQAIIDYIDKTMGWIGLGHELSSQSSPGPGQLGVSAALEVRQDILEGDCDFAAEVIRRDVLVPITGWNFGWENVDLAPIVWFDYAPPSDLKSEAETISTIAKTFPGLLFSEQQVRDTFGYDAPLQTSAGDEPDVLEPASPPPPGSFPNGPQGPDANPASPDISINRSLSFAASRKRARVSTAYHKSNQTKLDRLSSRGISSAGTSMGSWRRQLRELIVQGARDGLSLHEMTRRVARSYPELDAGEIEKTLHEQMLLARMFGRSA